MQREDNILEWILLANKQSNKLKTYIEKVSKVITKEKKSFVNCQVYIQVRLWYPKPMLNLYNCGDKW